MNQGRISSIDSVLAPDEAVRCRVVANEWIERWWEGKSADAAEAIEATPELLNHKTILLDLAYEEYCLRTEKGESLDVESFCKRFSQFRVSLERRIHVHQLLDSDLNLLRKDTWLEPGEQWLGYTVLKELGRGAFGRVYLATEDDIGGRLVAIKLTRFGGEEADRLGRLDHRNVVPIHSVKRSDDVTVICMPFLGTATLTDLLDVAAERAEIESAETILETALAEDPFMDQRPQSSFSAGQSYLDGLISLMIQVAEALRYSHQQGIFHLDLKPSNVLLARNGDPMLLDFNLSHDSNLERPERMGGTLPYMSPEQLRGVFFAESVRLNEKTDVFAFGIVMSQVFHGRLPFGPPPITESNEQTAEQLLERYQAGVQFESNESEDLIPSVCTLIKGCLSFDREDRPSLDEIITTLQKEKRWPKRLRRWFIRHPGRYGVGLALCVTTIAFLATTLALQPSYSDRTMRRAQQAFNSGDLNVALSRLAMTLESRPSFEEGLRLRAKIFESQRKYGLAANDLMNIVEKKSTQPRNHALIGYLFALAGEMRLAYSHSRRALILDPGSVELVENLALLHLMAHRYEEAKEAGQLALELNSRSTAGAFVRLSLSVRDRSKKPFESSNPILILANDVLEWQHAPWPVLRVAAIIFAIDGNSDGKMRLAIYKSKRMGDPSQMTMDRMIQVIRKSPYSMDPNASQEDYAESLFRRPS